MDDDLLVLSESKSKKQVRFAAEKKDSSEKFIAIINKLDQALHEVQEPRRFTPPNFEFPQLKRSTYNLDLPINEEEKAQKSKAAPLRPERKAHKKRNLHTAESLEPEETNNSKENNPEPAQSYLQIHQAQVQSAPKSPKREVKVEAVEKFSPKNLPKPKRRKLPPQKPLIEER